ncbi:DUF6153 family protein [Nocardioides bruguierae]|uniref:Uncharacterized protein n=1 Tax=Nocardioides bruguierae TaxID=2945102 RepID=A0A9X2D5M1_9ACTN|nr:DUF6153 family protein [Nocardioides bruguierae]MCM0619262.1 hypothetical protein [Nocardioides bruguierae]
MTSPTAVTGSTGARRAALVVVVGLLAVGVLLMHAVSGHTGHGAAEHGTATGHAEVAASAPEHVGWMVTAAGTAVEVTVADTVSCMGSSLSGVAGSHGGVLGGCLALLTLLLLLLAAHRTPVRHLRRDPGALAHRPLRAPSGAAAPDLHALSVLRC